MMVEGLEQRSTVIMDEPNKISWPSGENPRAIFTNTVEFDIWNVQPKISVLEFHRWLKKSEIENEIIGVQPIILPGNGQKFRVKFKNADSHMRFCRKK